jgi:hypothetical protein
LLTLYLVSREPERTNNAMDVSKSTKTWKRTLYSLDSLV